MCAVDDAHLLDSESLDVLAFVARRLGAESVALVFAGRDAARLQAQLAGVPTLRLPGLGTEAAIRLLMSSLPEPIDPAAAAQIAAATGGNPLALIDLAGELTAQQLTESSFADEPLPVGTPPGGVLPAPGPPPAAGRAAVAAGGGRGLDREPRPDRGSGRGAGRAREPRRRGGGGRPGASSRTTVRFRHPLVRSAAYSAAQGGATTSGPRRAVGRGRRGWAWSSWRPGTPRRRRWAPTPAVADRLERVADLAGRRGGLSSRASVLAQAAGADAAGGREVRPAGRGRRGGAGRGRRPAGQEPARRRGRGRARPAVPRPAHRDAGQPGDLHGRPGVDARRRQHAGGRGVRSTATTSPWSRTP